MDAVAFLQNLGGWELFVILLIILLLFGAGSIPKIARALGRSAHEFRKGLKDGEKEADEEAESEEEEPPTTKPGGEKAKEE